jgi:ribosomal protein S12 methylthiotransferase
MKIGIVTLGCDKNTVDNEYMAGLLAETGAIVVRAEADADENPDVDLDAVLINTCGFVETAKQQSIQSIISWIDHKRERQQQGLGRCRVFVAGCLTQRYRETLVQELPEVDGFMGVGEFDKVIRLVQSPPDAASPYNLIQEMPVVAVREGGLPRKQLGPQAPHAFLKIADGCNHNCSFCAIPSFKGRLRSVQKEILIAEARLLLSRGVKEINLVAQDTSDYGKDLYGRDYGISELISDISALPGDFWIRLFYFYPGGLNAKFIEAFQASNKICRYIDMPLQHLHPEVLHRMKRPHREIKTLEALENLRGTIPDLALRTTFITGFPGETNEHFDYLLEGAQRLRFNRLGAFPFSVEEGTPSATMPDQVPSRLRKSRYDRLMRAQQGISLELNKAMVGREIKVLIESQIEEDQWVGRSEFDAPDVDGAVAIHSREALRPGQFAMAKVVAADFYDLVAEA